MTPEQIRHQLTLKTLENKQLKARQERVVEHINKVLVKYAGCDTI